MKLGIYTIFWKSGGKSVASIYMDRKGTKWIAPANWTGPAKLNDYIESIKSYVMCGNN